MPINDSLLDSMITNLDNKITRLSDEMTELSAIHTSFINIQKKPLKIPLPDKKKGFEIVNSRPNPNNLNKADVEKTAEQFTIPQK